MELPRFLWVSFPLGRPFGAPNEPEFQRRVLHTALRLLEREDGPVILEDFPDDAPAAPDPGEGEAWACPVSFHPGSDGESELVEEVLAEAGRLAAWHEVFVAEGGRPAPPTSGLAHEEIVRGLGALADGSDPADLSTALPLVEWVRLGCEDLRTWYVQAAQGQPGRATAAELDTWFWEQTAFARLIASAAVTFARSEDPLRRIFGTRTMVPRHHMPLLMPGVEASSGELPGGSQS